jgi:hypothetical protein
MSNPIYDVTYGPFAKQFNAIWEAAYEIAKARCMANAVGTGYPSSDMGMTVHSGGVTLHYLSTDRYDDSTYVADIDISWEEIENAPQIIKDLKAEGERVKLESAAKNLAWKREQFAKLKKELGES